MNKKTKIIALFFTICIVVIFFSKNELSLAIKCHSNKFSFCSEIPDTPNFFKNQTLLGIDSNNNHIRDDVEQEIASKVSTDEDYKLSLAGARAYQKILELPDRNASNEVLLDIYSDINCLDTKMLSSRRYVRESQFNTKLNISYSIKDNVARATFNTPLRRLALEARTKKFPGFFGSDLKKCSVSMP